MHFWKPFSLFLRMLSTQHGLIILFFFLQTLNFSKRFNCISDRARRHSLSECSGNTVGGKPFHFIWKLSPYSHFLLASYSWWHIILAASPLYTTCDTEGRAHAERILLQSSSLSVCNEEGIWLHKTSLPKTCMLSCLPESCWSACLTLVVSGSLCWAYYLLW